MDGGFFLCPDAWEFLLPAEICHLRNAMAVCRKRWDLLTLTPMGCALLPEPAAVTGDPAAAGGLPQKRSPGGNSGDLRSVPTGQHHPVQPAGAGAVRPADAAAAVRRRIGATGISPAGGRGGGAAAARCGDPVAVDRLALSSVRNGAFTGSFGGGLCKIRTKTAMTASCVSVNRRARPRAS